MAVPEGVVLEPLAPAPRASAALAGTTTQAIGAFCLDYAKLPPTPGMLYRIAGQSVQSQFKSYRNIIGAARQMAAKGLLHPDSDPRQYVDGIKQWALWTRLERWNTSQFENAFVERTRKNLQELKQPWNKDLEATIRKLAPGRWRDIQAVLSAAR
jgi:hypothetical protein